MNTALPLINTFGLPQQTQNQTMLVPVQGESGAQMYPVAAGTTVALIDFDGCVFWLKTTDANGLTHRMRKFEFKETTPPIPGAENTVTREEFTSLKEQMNKILEALGEKKE